MNVTINRIFATTALLSALTALATTGYAMPRSDDGPPNRFQILSNAQDQASSYERADPNGHVDLRTSDTDYSMQRLNGLLTLTPDEDSSVRAVLSKQNVQVTAALHDKGLSTTERDVRLEAIYRSYDAQIGSKLSADQLLRFRIDQSRGMIDPDDSRLNKLFTLDAQYVSLPLPDAASQWGNTLNLTASQKMALAPILQTEDSTLDGIAVCKAGTGYAVCVQRQEAMVRAEKQIDALMTPDQKLELGNRIIVADAPATDTLSATHH